MHVNHIIQKFKNRNSKYCVVDIQKPTVWVIIILCSGHTETHCVGHNYIV